MATNRAPGCIYPLCGCNPESCVNDPMCRPLPGDITIGGATFRKGVKLGTFVEAARRWHRDAYPDLYVLTDEQKAENLARLQSHASGVARSPARTDLEWMHLPEVFAKFTDYAMEPTDANALRIIRAVREQCADGVDSSPNAPTEGEIGGIACNLWKRLGGTDLEWVNKARVRDAWTAAVADLLRTNGVREDGND